MAITREDVVHVAHLARLGLSDQEIALFQEQLNHILEAMQAMAALDTEHIPPTAQVIPVTSVMREDAERPSWPLDQALQNAPRREGDFIAVPAVLEEIG